MKKTYTLKLLVFLFLIVFGLNHIQSQNSNIQQNQPLQIENLSIYPNPVTNGKIFITTKLNRDKEIEIYDVLGKKVMTTLLRGKELNVSELNSGIYILKIKEVNASATRKLVIR